MFKLRNYHTFFVLLIASILTMIFTLTTLNLMRLGVANFEFIRKYGWVAIMEGALLQLLELVFYGIISQLSYFGFKLCEHELVQRYRAWQSD